MTATTPTIERIDRKSTSWPSQLEVLGADEPSELFGIGDFSLLEKPEKLAAITGSRASTQYGENVAREIAAELTMPNGIHTINGGSYGIEAAALRGNLVVGGTPVAVLPCGIETFYPRGNHSLQLTVGEKGLLLSTFENDEKPTRERFLARGRLIAALAGATVVVEAGARSGALAVASAAERFGRGIGAVPGPITSAASYGPNALIGGLAAMLVTGAADVVPLLQRIEDSWDDEGGSEF